MPKYSRQLQSILKDIGVTNDSMQLKDLMDDFIRKTYIAICDSEECCGQFHKRRIQKHVSKQTKACPDCGNALFWKEDK